MNFEGFQDLMRRIARTWYERAKVEVNIDQLKAILFYQIQYLYLHVYFHIDIRDGYGECLSAGQPLYSKTKYRK